MHAYGIGFVAAAVPVAGTIALLAVLALGALALHVARKAAASREPMFPELTSPAPDPETFARELAEGGNVDDDAARFTDVAHRSGVQQAYALLALVNTDGASAPVAVAEPAPTATVHADPFAPLADLAPPDPPVAEATTPAAAVPAPPATSTPPPVAGDVFTPADLGPVAALADAGVHPDDTLLPGRRHSPRRGRAA